MKVEAFSHHHTTCYHLSITMNLSSKIERKKSPAKHELTPAPLSNKAIFLLTSSQCSGQTTFVKFHSSLQQFRKNSRSKLAHKNNYPEFNITRAIRERRKYKRITFLTPKPWKKCATSWAYLDLVWRHHTSTIDFSTIYLWTYINFEKCS